MNSVLITRVTNVDSPLAQYCEKSYSLARPVELATQGPQITRDAIKDLIDCDHLASDTLVWDGLMVTLWYHDEDGELVGEDIWEREVACEVIAPFSGDVIAVVEGPMVVTGAVTADGIHALREEDAQAIADRVNAGLPLRSGGGLIFTFTELLAMSEDLG